MVERELPVAVSVRGEDLAVSGERAAAERTARLLEQLEAIAGESLRGGRPLQAADVRYLVQQAKLGSEVTQATAILTDTVLVTERGRPVGPKTAGQKGYVDAM